MTIRKCLYCGKEFETNTKKRLCSEECTQLRIKQIHKRQNQRKYGNADLKAKVPLSPTWLQKYEKSERIVRLSMMQKATGINYGVLSAMYGAKGDSEEYKELFKKVKETKKYERVGDKIRTHN